MRGSEPAAYALSIFAKSGQAYNKPSYDMISTRTTMPYSRNRNAGLSATYLNSALSFRPGRDENCAMFSNGIPDQKFIVGAGKGRVASWLLGDRRP